jgi:prepilin-type N-terminal cleavage/methylation domain-containing protein
MLISTSHDSLRSERGFTLIEVLVAMVTGVIVTGALFAILEVSMRQSTRVSDVAQATQLGRTAMNHIVDEEHSACIAADFVPVQVKSTPSTLILEDGYSEEAEVPVVGTQTTGLRKDEIIWSSSLHTLTDKTSLSTGEPKPGEYSWAAAKTVLLAEHVTQTGKLPIFRYYEFSSTASSSSTEGLNSLEKEPLKLGESGEVTTAQAKEIGSVLVAFTIAPVDNLATLGRAAEFDSQTTFTFSAPNSENPLKTVPCE